MRELASVSHGACQLVGDVEKWDSISSSLEEDI